MFISFCFCGQKRCTAGGPCRTPPPPCTLHNGEPTPQDSEGEARGERPQPPSPKPHPHQAHAEGTPIGKEPRREPHPTRRRTRRPPQRGSHRHTQQHTQHTKPQTGKPRRPQRQRPQTRRPSAAARRCRGRNAAHPRNTWQVSGRWVARRPNTRGDGGVCRRDSPTAQGGGYAGVRTHQGSGWVSG